MGYSQIAALAVDLEFTGRVHACCIEQAEVYRSDGRADIAELAEDMLRGTAAGLLSMYAMVSAAPGLADKATSGDGIDQSLVPDGDILAAVQADWPTIAALFYPTPAP